MPAPRFARFAPIVAAALVGAGGLSLAGTLSPPAGPVVATMKPLTDVEPRIAINATNTPGDVDSLYKITAPGSYYLTGNIQGAAGKSGIKISTNGVAIDLRGFSVLGTITSTDGITVSGSNRADLVVRNGTVRGWGGVGVNLANAVGARVEQVSASGNSQRGMFVGPSAIVRACSFNGNGAIGLVTSTGCHVSGCTAGTNAMVGIASGSGCTLSDCTAHDNTGEGISAGAGSTVTACSAYQNTTDGIGGSWGSTISDCSAYGNTTAGFSVSTACIVRNCAATANGMDGIVAGPQNFILNNNCFINGQGVGGAGIRLSQGDNRVEGNRCSSCDRGIYAAAPGSIIVRNTCTANTTNWVIAAGNALAPIVSVTTNAAAISGNSYAGGLGSTDPNANFSY